ncbi:MAG: PQQ-binding-like beta-propeller repeat protein, partial [Thermoplasmata archaeon]|nr:PQQ-binding-like beta-propeller repeat protein [Thermoplasmata archaeon]
NLTGDINEEIVIEPEYLIYYPVVDMNGTIYVVTIENDLIAYHANGTLRWTLPLSGEINSPPTVRGDGNIYLSEKVDLGINLHCIYPNGTKAWTTVIVYGDICHRSVSVDSLGNAYLVIEFWGKSDRMYCVNSSGSIVWSKSLEEQIDSPVWVSDNGTVFIQMRSSLHLIEDPGVLVHELLMPPNLSGAGGMAFDHDGNIYLVRGTLYCIGMADSSPPSFISGRIEDQFADEDEGLIMDLYHLFSDAEGLVFEYECDNPDFNVTIYDDLCHFRFPANYSGIGNARIKAISSGDDEEFGTTDDTFTWTNWFKVTVLPANDPPLLVEMEFPGADEGAMYHHDLQILDNDSDVDFTTVRIEGSDWLYAKGHALEGIPPRND